MDRPPLGTVFRSFLQMAGGLLLAAGVVFFAIRYGGSMAGRGAGTSSVPPSSESAGGRLGASAPSPDAPHDPDRSPFVGVAEKVLPAVVNISVERTVRRDGLGGDGAEREGRRQLFPEIEGEDVEIPSRGSGFLIDPDGHVITNSHVIRGADTIRVTLADGSEYDAGLVGSDPPSDIAVLKLAGDGPFPFVAFGDSDALRIGDWVAAIGNPFGHLVGTLTVGVVSAKGRNELAIAGGTPTYQDFIQTDASINFGNSGGPLVNTRGEAVGINTAFNAPGRGIGFAISMSMARGVIDDLIRTGRVVRGFLGIRLQDVDPRLGETWGLKAGDGVRVGMVLEGTPAAQAGLRAGDILVEFNGRPVDGLRSFQRQVADTRVGSDIEIGYVRDGRRSVARVRLAERPDSDAPAAHQPPPEAPEAPEMEEEAPGDGEAPGDDEPQSEDDEPAPGPEPAPGGARPSDDEILWMRLGLRVSEEAALSVTALRVLEVEDGGPAAASGLAPGDLIAGVGGRPARSLQDILSELVAREAEPETATVVLRIDRGGSVFYTAVTSRGR